MRVTVEIDLNSDYVETVGEAESVVSEIVADRFDDSENVVRWNIIKVEVTE